MLALRGQHAPLRAQLEEVAEDAGYAGLSSDAWHAVAEGFGDLAEVMQRDVLSVCPRTSLRRVLAKLVAARVRSFPVLDDDRVVGVVARRDVMRGMRRGTGGHRP